ncbi:MAG TPA: hypothetical protein VIJ86_12420 [Acidimicrobiales bacterium]
MEKSQLREALYEVGRSRLFDTVNTHAGPFTHVCRLVNPEGARMSLHYAPGVRVEAWHQSGNELAALYSWNGVWILFDRFNVGASDATSTDTVVVISAPTLDLQVAAGSLIMQSQESFDVLWMNAGDDD